MRGYAKIALVSILMMGLLAVPNLSPATDGSTNRDGNGRHSLLNAELKSKIEHLRDKISEHREDHHNQGGIPGTLQALQMEISSLKTDLATANAQLLKLATRLNVLETPTTGGGGTSPALVELAKYVTVEPGMLKGLKGPHVIFHHANVHVESGSSTIAEASAPTGLGNLIVGNNELPGVEMPGLEMPPVPPGGSRVGSHNLVVGSSHTYTSTGGVVFGSSNWISGHYATNLGGFNNWSTAALASANLGGVGVRLDYTGTYP